MPVKNRMAELLPEITAWRRDFHENPELLYEVHRTAGKVAELLRSFGVDEVVEGVGRTGVVGVIKGRSDSSGRARPTGEGGAGSAAGRASGAVTGSPSPSARARARRAGSGHGSPRRPRR